MTARLYRISLLALIVIRQQPGSKGKASLRVEHIHARDDRFYIPNRVRTYPVRTELRMRRLTGIDAEMRKLGGGSPCWCCKFLHDCRAALANPQPLPCMRQEIVI